MSSKKKAYLQQFGIIHLPNPDLIYIRNPERETKLFLCPSTSSDTDGCAADTSAHIYARGGSFSELGINDNLGWGIVGEDFFYFCQKK